MLLASARKDFQSPWALSNQLQLNDAIESVRGQHVCVLIHGYRVEYLGAVQAYRVVEGAGRTIGLPYQSYIGFLWPGSPLRVGFLAAVGRANASAVQLKKLVDMLDAIGCTVSVETHSLGARVALQAIKLGARFEHVVLTAPAVDDDVFEEKGEFYDAPLFPTRFMVMYSRRDKVLRYAYRLSEVATGFLTIFKGELRGARTALGLNGLRHEDIMIQSMDLTESIPEHSAYKDCPKVYELWNNAVLRPERR